ncbi:MAG: HAD family hydrolase [Desulfatibacillaceae bacterium]
MGIKAVIFDLGGVILESPMEVFAAFERERGLPQNFLNRLIVNAGEQGAWARLERGELNLDRFFKEFDEEIRAAGADISSSELMMAVAGNTRIRDNMLQAVRRIRAAGFKVAALTNNWLVGDGTSTGLEGFTSEFDQFVESSREGLAKPDPGIYQVVLDRLGVQAGEAVFLDDIGRNLKPARAMGMTTIKVGRPEQALAELGEVLGMDLSG